MAHWRSLVEVVRHFKTWPTHVADFLGLIRPGIMHYELRNGVRFNARSRTRDSMVIREVWLFNDYIPPGLEFAADATILDIGGHIGAFAIYAARLAPKGRVFAFEPTAESFALLKQNLDLNAAANITALNLAVFGQSGQRELKMAADQVSHSVLFGPDDARRVTVEGIALGDFVRRQKIERIDFLKLDCEGAEFEILTQCPDDVLSLIQRISAEVHGYDAQHNRESLGQLLKSRGFEIRLDPRYRHMLYARKPNSPTDLSWQLP